MSMEYEFRNKYELQAENKRLRTELASSKDLVESVRINNEALYNARDLLKAELKAISQALDDPRTDLTMTMLEVIRELKGQTK